MLKMQRVLKLYENDKICIFESKNEDLMQKWYFCGFHITELEVAKWQFIMRKIKQRLFNQHANCQSHHTITIISQLLAVIK